VNSIVKAFIGAYVDDHFVYNVAKRHPNAQINIPFSSCEITDYKRGAIGIDAREVPTNRTEKGTILNSELSTRWFVKILR
jgi:hypothetical protein